MHAVTGPTHLSAQQSQPFAFRFLYDLEGVRSVISDLCQRRYACGTGSDEEQREIFVPLQGEIEKKLSQDREVQNLVGVIHTPTPPTPLCVTENPRAPIIGNYLQKGFRLIALYPEGGLEKRTAAEQREFATAKSQHTNLEDHPFSGNLPDGLSGASYFFTVAGKEYLFSIQATQAHITGGNMAMWFGPTDSPKVQERADQVKSFLSDKRVDIGRA